LGPRRWTSVSQNAVFTRAMISTTTHGENQPGDIDALGGGLLHSGSQPMRRSRSSCGTLRRLPSTPESDAMTACGSQDVKHGDVVGVELHIRRDLRLRFADEFGMCVASADLSPDHSAVPKRDGDRANNRYPCFCRLRVQSSSECQEYQARIYNEQCASTRRPLECIFLRPLKINSGSARREHAFVERCLKPLQAATINWPRWRIHRSNQLSFSRCAEARFQVYFSNGR